MCHIHELEHLLLVIGKFSSFLPEYLKQSLQSLYKDVSRYNTEITKTDINTSNRDSNRDKPPHFSLGESSSIEKDGVIDGFVRESSLGTIKQPDFATPIVISSSGSRDQIISGFTSSPECEDGSSPLYTTACTSEPKNVSKYETPCGDGDAEPGIWRRDGNRITTGMWSPWEVIGQSPETIVSDRDLLGHVTEHVTSNDEDFLPKATANTDLARDKHSSDLGIFNSRGNSTESLCPATAPDPDHQQADKRDPDAIIPNVNIFKVIDFNEQQPRDSEKESGKITRAFEPITAAFIDVTPELTENIEPIRTSTPRGPQGNRIQGNRGNRHKINATRGKNKSRSDVKPEGKIAQNRGLYSALWGSMTNMLSWYGSQSVKPSVTDPQPEPRPRSQSLSSSKSGSLQLSID